MRDYRKPENRQQFLQNAVNRNLLIQKLNAVKSEAEMKAMRSESELLEELIEVISKNDESAYFRLIMKLLLSGKERKQRYCPLKRQ
jgi:hypothetical protein